jgi:RND superfamily putative drug exporter
MLERWTRTVVRYRVLVLVLWSAVVVVGLVAASSISSLLSTSLAVPGTDSARADTILATHFGENVEGTFTVVMVFNHAPLARLHLDEQRIATAVATVPTARVLEQRAIGGVLYVGVGTRLDLLHATAQTPLLRHALASEGLPRALVTGPPALNFDLTPVLAGDLYRGEIIAFVVALLLLILVLGLCWAVAVPFLVAAATTGGAVAIVYLLAHYFLMVLYIPNVIELVALGLAIDYSLLMVHRFRTEVALATTIDDAIVATMMTAGRTILLSGMTVAIGLATLVLVPVPFVRSLGTAGLVVPIVALVAVLTLQPALLSLLGQRGVRPVFIGGLSTGRDVLTGAWSRVARAVLARPAMFVSSSLAVLALVASFAWWLQLTPGSVVGVPSNLESARAIDVVGNRIGTSFITPNQIVIDLGHAHLAGTTAVLQAKLALATSMLHDPEVFATAIDTKAPFVDPTGRYEQILVIGRHEFGAEQSQQLVTDLRSTYLKNSTFPSGTALLLAGPAAQGVDFLGTVYRSFPWIVALALVMAFLVLVRAFRSLALALMAVLLDLVSVAAVYGLLVVTFRDGVGSALLGTYHVSQIEGWVPVVVFAMLFGLSMDYEVFIVSRMREAWDRGRDNNGAITDGLAHTGGVVSAAALILVGALSGLVVGHVAGLQELGVGLALGVVIDATIVRGLVVPGVMAMLGRWNWWLPDVVARLVHAPPSPLEERGARVVASSEGVT